MLLPSMSDSSESFNNVQEPIETEPPVVQNPKPAEPLTIEGHLKVLYDQVRTLTDQTVTLEKQLEEAIQVFCVRFPF